MTHTTAEPNSGGVASFGFRRIGRVKEFGIGTLMEGVDAVMRRLYHVSEYDSSPQCLFRIAHCEARDQVTLRDGTLIEPGMAIGELHLWNEHLPRFSNNGPDLLWAKALLQQVRYSLRTLSRHIEREAEWRRVQAFRASPALPFRPSATKQLRSVAEAYGFELPAETEQHPGPLALLAEGVRTWSFERAYNPAANPCLLRGRQDLWLSRSSLLQRYGGRAERAGRWEG